MPVSMPVGYSGVSSYTGGDGAAPASSGGSRDAEIAKLRIRKMWEAARSPISGVLMSAVMMYMVGNNIQIFPLIMIGMTCMNAVKNLFAVSSGLFSFSPPLLLVFLFLTLLLLCSVQTVLRHSDEQEAPRDRGLFADCFRSCWRCSVET